MRGGLLERTRMRVGHLLARSAVVGVAALSLMGLAACGTTSAKADKPGLFGLGGSKPQTGGPAQIGVNGYLWRATLDTLSFMPLASADPYGGVVITDWYTNPEVPTER